MIFPFNDTNPTTRRPWVTVGLVTINVLVFLYQSQLPPEGQQALIFRRAFIPARLSHLQGAEPLRIVYRPEASDVVVDPLERVAAPVVFQFSTAPSDVLPTLVTSMFLHGGWMHLLGNMWFLWLFGNNVEDRLGAIPFLLFYGIGGVLAALCHWFPAPNETVPVLGASGGVAAILGAYAVTWPKARIRSLVVLVVFVTVLELPALIVLGVWFGTQIIEAIGAYHFPMGGGVAWWAHIGGFLAGALLMPVARAVIPPPVSAPTVAPLSPPPPWNPHGPSQA